MFAVGDELAKAREEEALDRCGAGVNGSGVTERKNWCSWARRRRRTRTHARMASARSVIAPPMVPPTRA